MEELHEQAGLEIPSPNGLAVVLDRTKNCLAHEPVDLLGEGFSQALLAADVHALEVLAYLRSRDDLGPKLLLERGMEFIDLLEGR